MWKSLKPLKKKIELPIPNPTPDLEDATPAIHPGPLPGLPTHVPTSYGSSAPHRSPSHGEWRGPMRCRRRRWSPTTANLQRARRRPRRPGAATTLTARRDDGELLDFLRLAVATLPPTTTTGRQDGQAVRALLLSFQPMVAAVCCCMLLNWVYTCCNHAFSWPVPGEQLMACGGRGVAGGVCGLTDGTDRWRSKKMRAQCRRGRRRGREDGRRRAGAEDQEAPWRRSVCRSERRIVFSGRIVPCTGGLVSRFCAKVCLVA